MTTYSEKNGRSPFNWTKFLDRAINGKATFSEKLSAFHRSTSWVTCACGNQCNIIPRDEFGAPLDSTLRELGSPFNGFTDAISKEDYKKAKSLLLKIEKRSAYLIKKELAPKIKAAKELLSTYEGWIFGE